MTDTAEKTNKPRIAPDITGIATGIAIPEVAKLSRGSKSIYDFDALAVGAAFGVKNKDAKQMQSIASNQNRKADNQQPVTNADGTIKMKMVDMKDLAGVVVGKTAGTEPETTPIKEFRAFDVTKDMAKAYKGTPLEGAKVVVFRVK